MNLAPLVSKNLVTVSLKSRTRETVISEIVEDICKQKKIKSKKEILESILEREKQETTAIGHGVAIPHTRLGLIKDVLFFVGVSKTGIDFSSPDGKPVHLVFLFITPLTESQTHLKILSKIANLIKKDSFINHLITAQTDGELYRLLNTEDVGREEFLPLTKQEICLELGTCEPGLSEEEAKKRLEVYGQNRLKKIKKASLAKRFLYNFTNLLAILMWVGSILAFLVEMPVVGWAIIAVIIINALFSFWQEFKAEKAIDALRNLIPTYARVIRDGEEKKVMSDDIVPGDMIILEEGDNVSADARLTEAYELRLDNSVFSGESRPAYKMAEPLQDGKNFLWTEIPNLIFAGTSVVSGSGKAVVMATGMNTEIGRIAYMTQAIKEAPSPLQKEIGRLVKVIAIVAVVMGLVFLSIGAVFTKMTFAASVIFAIGIILGNVPEGLMPTVTLALAMGVQKMAKRHALIKKLSSVETLGCTNVICTDKTGTLTTNQMSVRKIWLNDKVIDITGTGYEPTGTFSFQGKTVHAETFKQDNLELLIRAGVLCNTAKLVPPSETQKYWNIIGDPTEGALLVLSGKAGFDIDREREAYPHEKRFPFESVRKRMSSIHRMGDGTSCALFIKGAPKEVLELSTQIILSEKVVELTSSKRAEINEQIDQLAREGLRVLGFASRPITASDVKEATAQTVERDLVFIGATAMYDPPRPEVKDAIAQCRKAGIRVVMITGDYQITALSIAKQVGIVSSEEAEVMTGADLSEISDEQLKDKLSKKEVIFARVNPEHKLRVVSVLKDMGDIVAVTGDGVNDAPALKKADIGVAMGLRGTDVAREAAEMILTDDNFASIVGAIEEGRAVFSNIKKFITYIFAHLIPEAVPFILYVLLKIPAPITALQILAIDLGTETLPALALGVEEPEPGVMDVPPRSKKQGVVDKLLLFRGYVFLGLLNTAAVLAAYFYVLYQGGWSFGMQLEAHETEFTNPLHLKATTMVFFGIVVMQIANVFACRSERHSAFKIGFFNNKLILWGIVFELVFASILIYVPFFQNIFNTIPIGWKDWELLLIFMVGIFILEELRKRAWGNGTISGGRSKSQSNRLVVGTRWSRDGLI